MRVVVDRVCVWDHSTKMKTHSISARLGIAFAFLVSVLAGVGWLTTRRMSELNRDMKQTIDDHWAKVQIAGEALVYSNLNNRITMQIFLLDDREEIGELLIRRVQNSERISALLGQLEQRTGSERERELLSAVKAARIPYVESYKKNVNMLLNEKRGDEARTAMVRSPFPFCSDTTLRGMTLSAIRKRRWIGISKKVRAAWQPPAR